MLRPCWILVGFLVAFFALPLEARCEENKGGIKYIIPRLQFVLGESETWRSYAFVGLTPTSNDVSLAGVCHERYLASTPVEKKRGREPFTDK
jgi:hypothetical protein